MYVVKPDLKLFFWIAASIADANVNFILRQNKIAIPSLFLLKNLKRVSFVSSIMKNVVLFLSRFPVKLICYIKCLLLT